MQLINQTQTLFKLGKNGEFKINEVRDFDKPLSDVLLRYDGINSLESLKVKAKDLFPEKSKAERDSLKEQATELGLEFPSNISNAKLSELIDEAIK